MLALQRGMGALILAAVLAGAGACRGLAGYAAPPDDHGAPPGDKDAPPGDKDAPPDDHGAPVADATRRDLVGDQGSFDGPCAIDAPRIDSAIGPRVDGLALDAPPPDVLAPVPDVTASDAPAPDAPAPDAPKPDASKPDAPKPDAPKPDAPKPDAPAPDTSLDARPPDAGMDLSSDAGQGDLQGTSDAGISPWVQIPAGTFWMGSPTDEPCHDTDETRHQVTLTHAFEIQRTEVTQGQFATALAYNPSNTSCGSSCPVTNVNWHEAAAYCNALSTKGSLAACYACNGSSAAVTCLDAPSYAGAAIYGCPGYRLPTEAEWEYAYRATTTSALYNGDIAGCTTDVNAGAIGHYGGNATAAQPVRGKTPNAWGLYDMAGNVSEWCHDRYLANLGTGPATDPWGAAAGLNRVFRGGSFTNPASRLRAADRPSAGQTSRFISVGFRCVRTR